VTILGSRNRQDRTDEATIRLLYEQHGKALLAFATRLTGDPVAAEDVLQETLLRAWKHPDALVSTKGSVRVWLFTLARNLVIDRARARAVRPQEVPEVAGEATGLGASHRDHAEDVVDAMMINDALQTLQPSHRDVLVQIYFHGRTVTETARVLGIPAGTVKSRSFNALRALRQKVGSPTPSESVGT
jgi:RNA polymerase sigma-70 factor (ECF subfamily)